MNRTTKNFQALKARSSESRVLLFQRELRLWRYLPWGVARLPQADESSDASALHDASAFAETPLRSARFLCADSDSAAPLWVTHAPVLRSIKEFAVSLAPFHPTFMLLILRLILISPPERKGWLISPPASILADAHGRAELRCARELDLRTNCSQRPKPLARSDQMRYSTSRYRLERGSKNAA